MTVRDETPVIDYLGNGVTTIFAFNWSSSDDSEIRVVIDGTLAKEGVEYELEDHDLDFGGNIVFSEPPETGTTIQIYRETPITQELDYRDGDAFPAETHEFQMDKDTRILQEFLRRGRALGGTVDLEADQQETYTDIENTGGADARVEPWTVNGLLSGVALGEVVPYGSSPPIDGDPTTKPNGYIWWVLGVPPATGGDPQITMKTTAIVVESIETAPDVPRTEFDYDASEAEIGYGYDKSFPLLEPAWQTEEAFAAAVIASGNYLIQLETLSGDAPSGSAVDTWLDAVNDANWYLASGTFAGIVHIAPDAGGGSPDETLKISRYLTLHAEQN